MNTSSRITSRLERISSKNRGRPGHAYQDDFKRDDSARLQRITLERHGQGKDELADDYPAGDKRAGGEQQHRVEQQEGDNRFLVPARAVAEEAVIANTQE